MPKKRKRGYVQLSRRDLKWIGVPAAIAHPACGAADRRVRAMRFERMLYDAARI